MIDLSNPLSMRQAAPEAWEDIRLKSAESMCAGMVGPRPQNVIMPEMF